MPWWPPGFPSIANVCLLPWRPVQNQLFVQEDLTSYIRSIFAARLKFCKLWLCFIHVYIRDSFHRTKAAGFRERSTLLTRQREFPFQKAWPWTHRGKVEETDFTRKCTTSVRLPYPGATTELSEPLWLGWSCYWDIIGPLSPTCSSPAVHYHLRGRLSDYCESHSQALLQGWISDLLIPWAPLSLIQRAANARVPIHGHSGLLTSTFLHSGAGNCRHLRPRKALISKKLTGGDQAISQGRKDWLSSQKPSCFCKSAHFRNPWYRERHQSHERTEIFFSQPQISCYTAHEKLHLFISQTVKESKSLHPPTMPL